LIFEAKLRQLETVNLVKVAVCK